MKKGQSTLEGIFFATPEQKILRLLLSEPTTCFTPRVISSKLKGIRGLGGADGILRRLHEFQSLGLVDFVDNHRAVRVQDDSTFIQILKKFSAMCELENLRKLLEPCSVRGVLFGNHAAGSASSDCTYELFVVSDSPDDVRKIAGKHPLSKDLDLVVWTPELYGEIDRQDPNLKEKLNKGIVLWGSSW